MGKVFTLYYCCLILDSTFVLYIISIIGENTIIKMTLGVAKAANRAFLW